MKPTKVFYENLKAYKNGFRLIVNKGSSRSGKTRGIIQFADFILANSAKHRKLSVVSQSFPHLRDGAIYEYKKHIMDENLGAYRIHNQGNHEFSIGKSILNYFSLGDVGGAQKAVGPGRNILYLNEPNKGVSFENFNQLKTRTDEFVVMDYNPSGQFWLHTEKLIEDPRTIVIHSTWLDNLENLSKAQIQDFIDNKRKSKTSAYWDYWWKCYGEGQDAVLLEERIMPMLNWVKKVPDDAVEIPSALDFGFNPDPLFFGRLYVRKGKDKLKDDLFIEQIVYDTKLSINSKSPETKNLVDELDAKGVNRKHRIIAESAEPKSISDMRGAGFSIEAVRKTSVETSIRTFHDYNLYFVEGSEEAYNEFDNYKYKRDKQTNIILAVPEEKQADHSIDGCFSGDTLVSMERGYRRIDEIAEGEKVFTSYGLNRVLKVWNNGIKDINTYRIASNLFTIFVKCTEDHKFKTGEIWTPVKSLLPGQTISLHKFLMEDALLNIKVKDITQMVLQNFTDMFGSFIMGRFQKVSMSTMKMRICLITTLVILNYLKRKNTFNITVRKGIEIIKSGLKSFIAQALKQQPNIIKQKREEKKIKESQLSIKHTSIFKSKKNEYVSSVGKIIQPSCPSKNSVQITVNLNSGDYQVLTTLNSLARGVVKNLLKIDFPESDFVLECVLEETPTVRERRKEISYDLMVEKNHEYFANGILVHNCRYVLMSRNKRWSI